MAWMTFQKLLSTAMRKEAMNLPAPHHQDRHPHSSMDTIKGVDPILKT
jgi:hypothetical protein